MTRRKLYVKFGWDRRRIPIKLYLKIKKYMERYDDEPFEDDEVNYNNDILVDVLFDLLEEATN